MTELEAQIMEEIKVLGGNEKLENVVLALSLEENEEHLWSLLVKLRGWRTKEESLLYYNESLESMYLITFLNIWRQSPSLPSSFARLSPSLHIWSSTSTSSYDRSGPFGMIMSDLKKKQ